MEDRVKLSTRWHEIHPAERQVILHTCYEIEFYDGGKVVRIDGEWQVVRKGSANDHEGVVSPVRPVQVLDAATVAHANDVLRRWQGAYETGESLCNPEPSKAH